MKHDLHVEGSLRYRL